MACGPPTNALQRAWFHGPRARALPDDLLKQGVEFCRFYRLLQHWCVRKCRNNTVGPVPGDKCKWDVSGGENVGDSVGFLAAQVHIQYARLQIVGFGGEYCVTEAAIRPVDLVTESRQHICQHHRHEWLVFDEKYPFLIWINA